MGIDKLHFAGTEEQPTRLTEVFARQPRLGTGTRPKRLERLARRDALYVGGRELKEPEVDVRPVEEVRESVWRVEVDREDAEFDFVPGQELRREPAEFFLDDIDESISVAGYRPEWADVLYSPRVAPRQDARPLRRLDGSPATPHYVFGNDDRWVFQDASWPWGLVGRVFNNRGESGTGVLVGDRVVATAGHLVPWGDSPWWMRFVPAYFDGSSLHGSGVESYVSNANGYDVSGNVVGYDWAVLRLYEPLGESLGYFGYNGYSSSWNDEPYWSVVGYPGAVANALRPSFQNSVSIFDVDSDSNGGRELESQTADLTPGNSGGPIFAWWDGGPRVVGVVSGQEEDYSFPFSFTKGNVFASGSGFTNLLSWARTNWPA